jgi:hypothetical protein
MPTYTYRCQLCGTVSEHYVSVANRLDPQECEQPGCEGRADFEFCPPHDTEPREVREQGVIHDERQLPKNWRDQGTTRREGGMGRTLYFDQK